MDEEATIFLAFTGLFYLIGFSILRDLGHGALGMLAALLLLLGFALVLVLNWADSILFPMATRMLGVTFQPAANYKINTSQDAIIKEVNGIYYATGFVTANLFSYIFKLEGYEAATEEDRITKAPEIWERAVMSINFPFKYHVFGVGLDVQKIRDELEGKRSYQEFQLSRAIQGNANEVTITDIQRKINAIQAKIDMISGGEKPLATLMYIETTAIGVSEKAALDALATQINTLQIAFGGFDVDLMRVVGRELYTLFKFDFSLPTSFGEAAAHFDQQQ